MMNLKIFAKTVEQEVHDQLKQLMSVSVFRDAKVRIMPDTHAGKGCVIGFTADLGDKVVPNLVGVDVGCFTKDTKVKLADGRDLSFEELIKESENGKEHYGYSFNNEGKVTISKLDLPRKIKEVDELVEIILDNGEVIHSTLDHIFYDISRNEIEAKDLTIGTSLFTCYIDVATFEELCNYKNHKVISVKIIKEHTDVYCLTCFEYGNFALSSGVFVHNCGMYVGNLGKLDLSDERLAELDKFIRENIPSGMNVNNRENSVGFANLCGLHIWGCLRNVEHLHDSIGSLGGGNHFIELNRDSKGNVYLVIHTGSRNLGQQVCRYYQAMAIKSCNDHEVDVRSLVDKLKSEGRQKEIADALKELKRNNHKIPDDLCYLEGVNRDAYLHDMKICQEFAWQNREEIARRIMNHLEVASIERFQTVHNYIDFEDNIIRKGAIRCNKGEKVIIPLNMRDGSIIGIGKGNEDWNCSGPHGAGRLMSRKKAQKVISMDDFRNAMNGIYTTSVDESTLDESPMAYKPAEEIIELVKDTVDIVEVIKPIYNFKASE